MPGRVPPLEILKEPEVLIRHLFRLVALACALLAATGPAAADGSAARQEIRFAVLAFRPKPITEAQWRPVADYLSKSLDNRTVTLVALTYPELEEAVAQRKVDFVLAQPAFYVYLSTRYGLSSPLATLCNMENGVPVRTFGGVIAVQATRNDIQELGDLAGKRVATASAQSFGGYLMAAYELKGIRIKRWTIASCDFPQTTLDSGLSGGRHVAWVAFSCCLRGYRRSEFGHDRSAGKSPKPSSEWLQHSETCPTGYFSSSANADRGPSAWVGRECAGHLPFRWN